MSGHGALDARRTGFPSGARGPVIEAGGRRRASANRVVAPGPGPIDDVDVGRGRSQPILAVALVVLGSGRARASDPTSSENASCPAPRWQLTTVSDGACYRDALGLVRHQPVVAYRDTRVVRLARREADGTWVDEVVAPAPPGSQLALALATDEDADTIGVAWNEEFPNAEPGRRVRIGYAQGLPHALSLYPRFESSGRNLAVFPLDPRGTEIVYSAEGKEPFHHLTTRALFRGGVWRRAVVEALRGRPLIAAMRTGGLRHLIHAGQGLAYMRGEAGVRTTELVASGHGRSAAALTSDPADSSVHLVYVHGRGQVIYLHRLESARPAPGALSDLPPVWSEEEVVDCLWGPVSATAIRVVRGVLTVAAWVEDRPLPVVIARRRGPRAWTCERPQGTVSGPRWSYVPPAAHRPNMRMGQDGELHVSFCDASGLAYGYLAACPAGTVASRPASAATVSALAADLERRSIWGRASLVDIHGPDLPVRTPDEGVWLEGPGGGEPSEPVCQRFLPMLSGLGAEAGWPTVSLDCDQARGLCRLRGLRPRVAPHMWPIEAFAYEGEGPTARVRAVFGTEHQTCDSGGCGPFGRALQAETCRVHDALARNLDSRTELGWADGFWRTIDCHRDPECTSGAVCEYVAQCPEDGVVPNPLAEHFGPGRAFSCSVETRGWTTCRRGDVAALFRTDGARSRLMEMRRDRVELCLGHDVADSWPCGLGARQ